jgi:hypothetical protein
MQLDGEDAPNTITLTRAPVAGRREGELHHEYLKPRVVVLVDGDLNLVEQRMNALPLRRPQRLLRTPAEIG